MEQGQNKIYERLLDVAVRGLWIRSRAAAVAILAAAWCGCVCAAFMAESGVRQEIYASFMPENGVGREIYASIMAESGVRPAQAEETVSVIRSVSGSAASDVSLTLYSQSAVLMDADTGRVLYGKDMDTARPMASTTKIMTCILALEYGDPEDIVTVSSYAASQPQVHLGAPAGRKFRLKDLLYSLMLESHNDTAVMIAEHIGGSVSGFAEMMNQKAIEIGCADTFFVTPNGLDATAKAGDERQHSTTARDLAAMMAYCVWQSPKAEKFLEITRTQNHYFTDLEGKGNYSCVNHNAFLNMMSGVLSGKTGFTGGAGYCYVAALEDGERHYTLALLGCGWPPHKTYKWSDARKLFEYGLETYEIRDQFRKPNLPDMPVSDGIPESGDLSSEALAELEMDFSMEDGGLPVLVREGEQASMRLELPDHLDAPVKRGDLIGQAVYSLGDTVIRSIPVYAAEDVPAVTWSWCLRKLLTVFIPY